MASAPLCTSYMFPPPKAGLLSSPVHRLEEAAFPQLPGPHVESACHTNFPIMQCCSVSQLFASLVPGKESLIGQMLRSMGSYKNVSITLPVKVSINTSCVQRTEIRKNVDQNLTAEVPILGERELTSFQGPWFCDFFLHSLP